MFHPSARVWAVCHTVVVVGFLAVVVSYYQPGLGFTTFLSLPPDHHDAFELTAVREVPHAENPDGGYDGQYYARLALVPLLRDPAIDKTMDLAPYRARRILSSWTAYVIGIGRPAWVLEAFALQNVAVWLALAWLLLRWFPVGSLRSFVLWAGCLATHGLLTSVRDALPDAMMTLLVVLAVIAMERARPWLAALALGLAGLARETALVAVTILGRPLPRSAAARLGLAGRAIVAILPLAIWLDYLRSIYRGGVFETGGNLTVPLAGFLWKVSAVRHALRSEMTMASLFSACVLVALVVQAGFMIRAAFRSADRSSPWVPVALGFAALGVLAHAVVWEGTPGAITRVTLPLALGFNVVARRASWATIVCGNLAAVPGVLSFVLHW